MKLVLIEISLCANFHEKQKTHKVRAICTYYFLQSELQNKFASGIAKAQSANSGYKFEMVPIKVARDDEDGNSFNNTCDVAKSQSFSAIVDLTWGGWHEMKMEAQKNGMPYVRLEGANHQFVKVNKSLFMTFVTFPIFKKIL